MFKVSSSLEATYLKMFFLVSMVTEIIMTISIKDAISPHDQLQFTFSLVNFPIIRICSVFNGNVNIGAVVSLKSLGQKVEI